MNRKTFAIAFLIVLIVISSVFAQDKGNDNSADNALRGSGRVNPSTLGMEFQLSLGSYAGRGINVPINISYSSKLWRMESLGNNPIPGANYSRCFNFYAPMFAEKSASGWTTSLATPYIEYTGAKNYYNSDGTPYNYNVDCPSSTGGTESYPQNFIRRILVHLPSGETHELRPNDTVESIPVGTNCLNSGNACSPASWNVVYYAADGSNIKYVQDSVNGVFKLLMPDGSFYDFDPSADHLADRKAVKFTDRNGNHTDYHEPTNSYPNGYWIDTLGRTLAIPLALDAPNAATAANDPQVYSLPGITGTYKLHWKQLKGASATESAIGDFNLDLKYVGESYVCQNGAGNPTYCRRPAGTFLFDGGEEARILKSQYFNPVLLKEIELPTGQKYKFSYDVYGRIDKIAVQAGDAARRA